MSFLFLAKLTINNVKINIQLSYIQNLPNFQFFFPRAKTVPIQKSLHLHQRLQRNHLARRLPRRVLQRRRLRPQTWPIGGFHRPGQLVRPDLGPDRLQFRHDRVRHVPDRQLWIETQVRGLRRPPGNTCRIYPRVSRFL